MGALTVRSVELDAKCKKMHTEGGMTIRAIAAELGMNRNTVANAVKGIPLKRVACVDPAKANECIKLASEGLCDNEIARKLNVTQYFAKKSTREWRETKPKVKRTLAVIKNEASVLDLYEQGFNQQRICKDLNLGRGTVQAIIESASIKQTLTKNPRKRIFQTKPDPCAGRYPMRVDSKTVIYPKATIPKEQAEQQWNQRQQIREASYRASVRSHQW